MTATTSKKIVNNLDKIFSAMRTGKYIGIHDSRGNFRVGLINGIAREDGSGRNWIVSMTSKNVVEKIFIYAV